jgi:hypothetical protein
LKAAIIAASAASHRVAPAALVARPEGTPTTVFAEQHEFPKNPLMINVTGIVGIGQVRCIASIQASRAQEAQGRPRNTPPPERRQPFAAPRL